jgi:hypothetical protein
MGKARATVLMVDADIALLLILADELDQRGISLIPSGSARQARLLGASLKPMIDVLIVNCKVAGVCTLAAEMVGPNPLLEIIGIVAGACQCSSCRALLTYCFHDPEIRDLRWTHRMVSLIQSRTVRKQKPGVIRIMRSSRS